MAPPGAGLPWIERKVGGLWFGLRRRRWTVRDAMAHFEAERILIREELGRIPVDRRGERVLISRLPGLEDSSRWWSAWMTLDHLRICHEVFAGVIRELHEGRLPPGMADTAAVKPSPEAGAAVEEAFDRSCEVFLASSRLARTAGNLAWPHPWFGPLDARGWHALGAMHLGIHRLQLRAISRNLDP